MSEKVEDARIVQTKHGPLSLEEIAAALPGTGEVMASVGHAYGMCWHAAHGGNWDLALYYLRRVRSLLRGLAVTRPKYREQIREFDRLHLESTYQCLSSRDLDGFDAAYAGGVARANEYHVDTGHPYIRWRRPERPADEGVDLGPGVSGRLV